MKRTIDIERVPDGRDPVAVVREYRAMSNDEFTLRLTPTFSNGAWWVGLEVDTSEPDGASSELSDAVAIAFREEIAVLAFDYLRMLERFDEARVELEEAS